MSGSASSVTRSFDKLVGDAAQLGGMEDEHVRLLKEAIGIVQRELR